MTTTMSRLTRGMSNESCEPPCISAPNSTAAKKIPTGWLRPINATAMPTNPAPAGKSSRMRCCEPISSLRPSRPASAPESSIA